MFKLLRYFSVMSLIAFAIVTALLAYFYRRSAVEDLMMVAQSKNVALTQTFANSLWPEFSSFVRSSSDMSGDELRAHPKVLAFHRSVLDQMQGLSVVKVKVYNVEGLTVYSSEFDQIGASKLDNPGFQTALAGGVASAISYRDSFNAFEGSISNRNVFESYLPLRSRGADGDAEAVIELYDDVTPLLQAIDRTQRNLTLGVALTLLILYLLLFYIVRHADKILRQQYREITQANAELEQQAKELARSNAELEQFAYTASHDLQEPLRKIQAFGQRLSKKHGDTLGDEGKLYLERMESAANRMRALIHDLLAFSRVSSKGGSFDAVDLNRVAREVLADLEVRIGQTGARVELSPLPTVEADAMQMRQLLQNLIGNALKFSRPDTPPVVRIYSEPDDGNVRIVVADNGIGFEAEYAERIFTIFQRLHGRGEYEGTGMGLAIVRKIVERHRGTIVAEGEDGSGATFRITLPSGGHLAPALGTGA